MNLAGNVAGKGLSMAAYLARSGAELAMREDAIMWVVHLAMSTQLQQDTQGSSKVRTGASRRLWPACAALSRGGSAHSAVPYGGIWRTQ